MPTTTLSGPKKVHRSARLVERADPSVVRVDRTSYVLRGVKLIGRVSQNRRIYPEQTLKRAASMYEGLPCFVDHGEQVGSMRSYKDKIGTIRNVQFRGDGLFADLFVNRKHPLAEMLIDDAENAPQSVGISHAAEGDGTRDEHGNLVVEQIHRVVSCDLVTMPASVGGLFEGAYRRHRKEQGGKSVSAWDFCVKAGLVGGRSSFFEQTEPDNAIDRGEHAAAIDDEEEIDPHKQFRRAVLLACERYSGDPQKLAAEVERLLKVYSPMSAEADDDAGGVSESAEDRARAIAGRPPARATRNFLESITRR